MLEKAKEIRHHKFTRVSKTTLDDLEGRVYVLLYDIVRMTPSKGKTL